MSSWVSRSRASYLQDGGVDGSIPLGELCSPSLHIKVPLGKMPSPELTSKYPSECECQCVRMFIKCLDAEKSSLYKAVLVVQVYAG